jgi:hypothetical protein
VIENLESSVAGLSTINCFRGGDEEEEEEKKK